jgi:hypothetical protein
MAYHKASGMFEELLHEAETAYSAKLERIIASVHP